MSYTQDKSTLLNVNKPLPASPTISTIVSPATSLDSLDLVSNTERIFESGNSNRIRSLDNLPTMLAATASPPSRSFARFLTRQTKPKTTKDFEDRQQKSDCQPGHGIISRSSPEKIPKRSNRKPPAKLVKSRDPLDKTRDKLRKSISGPTRFYPQGNYIDLPPLERKSSFSLANMFNKLKRRIRSSAAADEVGTKVVLPSRPIRPSPHLCQAPINEPSDAHDSLGHLDRTINARVPGTAERILEWTKAVHRESAEDKRGTSGQTRNAQQGGSIAHDPIDRDKEFGNYREDDRTSLQTVRPEDSFSRRNISADTKILKSPPEPPVAPLEPEDRTAQSSIEAQTRLLGQTAFADSETKRRRRHLSGLNPLPESSSARLYREQSILEQQSDRDRLEAVRDIGDRLREKFGREWEESRRSVEDTPVDRQAGEARVDPPWDLRRVRSALRMSADMSGGEQEHGDEWKRYSVTVDGEYFF